MSDKTIEELLDGLEHIINNSYGVDGWHLNGDVATWDELEVPSTLQAIRKLILDYAELTKKLSEVKLDVQNPNRLDMGKPRVSREKIKDVMRDNYIPWELGDFILLLTELNIEVSDE